MEEENEIKPAETAAEKKPQQKEEEKAGVPLKWQKWFYLFMSAVSVVNIVAGLIPLLKLFNGLRLFSIILWAVAGVFFGAAAHFAWKAEEKEKKDQTKTDRRA